MAITDPMVLPVDVLIIPYEELGTETRKRLHGKPTDYAITRARSRSSSKLIDRNSAALLEAFREPIRINEAVIEYSRARGLDPRQVLARAFPIIRDCVNASFLVRADSPQASPILPIFDRGDRIGQFEVLRCVQVLEDTELYQARDVHGKIAAIKVLRRMRSDQVQNLFQREIAVLQLLHGDGAPALLEVDAAAEEPHFALEWRAGVEPTMVAAEIRDSNIPDQPQRLLQLSIAITEAYARLHERGIIHSDVHEHNLLIDDKGNVTILDFGYARMVGDEAGARSVGRGGIGFFFEPEYAAAMRAGTTLPPSTAQSEQYSVAALLFLLLTGDHYLEFSVEKEEMFRQIVEDEPLHFSRRGMAPWPSMERVLQQALSKEPAARFPSMRALADALVQVQPAKPTGAQPFRRSALDTVVSETCTRLQPSEALFAADSWNGPICSLNFGIPGIAYGLYRIACITDDAPALFLADSWMERAMRLMGRPDAFHDDLIRPEIAGNISPYYTASGVHCVRALIKLAMNDRRAWDNAVQQFVASSQAPCRNLDLTLGRAGTLLACALLLEANADEASPAAKALRQLGNVRCAEIWHAYDGTTDADREPITNLGMAHGSAGLIYVTLRWSQCSNTPLPQALEAKLELLARSAEQSGRGARWQWVQADDQQAPKYMPGWCNGSAGFVHLWTLAHRRSGGARYLDLAAMAAWNAWEDTSSTIPDLCCGLAGRAYALLNLYKHTGDPAWLERAHVLAARAADLVRQNDAASQRFMNSLYRGGIGVAVLGADLTRPESSAMPFFEEEGWPTTGVSYYR